MTSPEHFRPALQTAFDLSLRYLEGLSTAPVGAPATAQQLREALHLALPENPTDATAVLERMSQAASAGLHGVGSGRFFGWVMGGSVPASLAADWLTSTWDQNAAMFAVAPAAAIVEEVAGVWLKDLLGLPAGASFAFVTGCQMAHTTALAAARHRLLADRGWDVKADGLCGAPPLRVLTSGEVHGSVPRALSLLGVGSRAMHRLPADAEGRLSAETLAAALSHDPEAATIVVLQAGDLNIGAYDDFQTLIPIAKQHRAWVHIDGAFGLWAAASPQLRHLMRGAEMADSWATDGHKWLNVPYDSGYSFVADPEAHRSALSHRAAYLTHATDARDQMDWNPEWSRRARGFATYAALHQMGRSGVAEMIDRTCAATHALVTRIGALPGAEMLWEPQINQGLVRFLHPQPDAGAAEHDAFTDHVIAAIAADGEAFFTGTTWRGMRAMRVSVCGWSTDAADVDRAVQSVADVLQRSVEAHRHGA